MFKPTLTLCVVAYNEQNYIKDILNDILNQTYPKELIDFILVDSCSKDDTMAILKDFAKAHENEYMCIRTFTNKCVTVPHGLNIALENAKGEVFIRIDAHAKLPKDFIEKELALLENHDACGGKRPCIIKEDTKWNNTLLMAEESMFGSSISAYRKGEQPSFAKSLFHGAYRMDILKKIGFYDERLPRSEDNDMSYRHRANGYKLYYDPSIVSYQYMRPNLWQMMRQKFANGRWIAITTAISPKCLSIYHFVPFAFVSAIMLFALIGAFGSPFPLIALLAAYALAALVMSVMAVLQNKKRSLFCLLLPFIFFLLHTSYGIGSWTGFVSLLFNRKKYTQKQSLE